MIESIIVAIVAAIIIGVVAYSYSKRIADLKDVHNKQIADLKEAHVKQIADLKEAQTAQLEQL